MSSACAIREPAKAELDRWPISSALAGSRIAQADDIAGFQFACLAASGLLHIVQAKSIESDARAELQKARGSTASNIHCTPLSTG